MPKLRLSIELFEDNRPSLETEIESFSQFRQIVTDINEAEDGDMVIVGDIALRAGTIKYLFIAE